MKIILVGKHKIKVDDSDYDKLKDFTWTVYKGRNTFYASTCVNGKTTTMHKIILNPSEGFHADHIDGDGLNNQINNLRQASRSQNAANRQGPNKNNKSSGYRGVYPVYKNKKFTGHYKAKLGHTYLGYFYTKEEAALAYDKAARKKYGPFSGKLNFN